jgi:hypothetical protein
VTGYRGAQTAFVIGGSHCVSWAVATCRDMSAWLHGGKEIKRGNGLNGAKCLRKGGQKAKKLQTL